MDSDNIIFPFILLILIGAWFYIFKIMPSGNTPIIATQTATPIAIVTQAPAPASSASPLPTPFATKPSINIPGGGEFEND